MQSHEVEEVLNYQDKKKRPAWQLNEASSISSNGAPPLNTITNSNDPLQKEIGQSSNLCLPNGMNYYSHHCYVVPERAHTATPRVATYPGSLIPAPPSEVTMHYREHTFSSCSEEVHNLCQRVLHSDLQAVTTPDDVRKQ